MRSTLICLAGLALVAACSKPPTDAAKANVAAPGAAAPQTPPRPAAPPAIAASQVSGLFTGDGKPAALTEVTAHKDEPFDGQPVTALVFSTTDQGGDADAAVHALFRKYGDAIVVRVEPDGTVIGADVIHSGLQSPSGSISLSGVLSMKDYKVADGEISGHLTSDGPTDVFDHKLQVDLTFRVKAP